MKRPIVRDPHKFDGQPHFEGTAVTVAAVQSYWREPGVYAKQIRERFPELSEDELGAAVTYAEAPEPEFSFSAETLGSPSRRFLLCSSPPGWMFAWYDVIPGAQSFPGFDTWDETYEDILRYVDEQTPKEIVWRDDKTGEVVDLNAWRAKLK